MSDDLLTNMKVSKKKWADEIKKEATKNLGKFAKLIKVSFRTVVKNGTLDTTFTAEAKKKKKPVARAYEYGSGIHSRSTKKSPKQQGSKGFVKIVPKRKKFLAFYWEKAIRDPRQSLFVKGKKLYRGGEDDIPEGARILLGSVQHPGVKAANNGRGYLSPAIAKVRRTMINKELPKDVKKAVLGTLKKSFGVAKK